MLTGFNCFARRIKVIGSIMAIMMLVVMTENVCAASASTTAYVYGFNYTKWNPNDFVNTTGIAEQERMYLSNMGYQTYCNTEVPASFAVANSPTTNVSRINSGVVAINGHAGPGSMQFINSTGTSSYLTGIKSGGSYVKINGINMSNCKAALFYGCKTASTDRESTHGVLTAQAVSNGAQCSFGFTRSVNTSSATIYRERMFYFMRKGYSVVTSASKAASEMPWNDATRYFNVKGNGSTVISMSKSGTLTDEFDLQAQIEKDANQIDYKTAMEHIKSGDYRLHDKSVNGSLIYVRYMNGIPSIESIEIDPTTSTVSMVGSGIEKIMNREGYTEKDLPSSIDASIIREITKRHDEKNIIMNDGLIFKTLNKSSVLDMYCIVRDTIKLVRIIETEFLSIDGESYYLDCRCFDLETGELIDYNEILNGAMS